MWSCLSKLSAEGKSCCSYHFYWPYVRIILSFFSPVIWIFSMFHFGYYHRDLTGRHHFFVATMKNKSKMFSILPRWKKLRGKLKFTKERPKSFFFNSFNHLSTAVVYFMVLPSNLGLRLFKSQSFWLFVYRRVKIVNSNKSQVCGQRKAWTLNSSSRNFSCVHGVNNRFNQGPPFFKNRNKMTAAMRKI